MSRLLVRSASPRLDFHDSCKLGLPLVTVLDQLLLVVEKLLVKECRVFKVRAFDNSIDGASFLAESTEYALGHVDVVLGGAARAIRPRLRLNRDGESWARGLAQFASNASLFTCGVSAQSMLASEHGG